ncbi:MAG: hypothetical protein KA290_13085, partial [Chitinophagaceae bacterium]|nr:hypothetical protein [Chitinophagaceae bacterium]
MRLSTLLFTSSLFLLFNQQVLAGKTNWTNHADTLIVTTIPAGEEEKQLIANAMNKYLDAVGIKLGELNLSNTNDGGKEASGNVSFFGFDNINLKATITVEKKIKSISTTFPEAASITPDKLVKFLSGKSLGSFFPKSFPFNT